MVSAVMTPIYLNGRFLSQPVTGVQRFAGEILASLDRLWDAADPDPPTILAPAMPAQAAPRRILRAEILPRGRGHVWEQVELLRRARHGVLVNLANSAPILAKRQLVVLHDAGIFAHPEAYSFPYRLYHKSLERVLARTRTAFATVSRFSRDEIAKYLRIPAGGIGVLSEGADHILRVAPEAGIRERNGLVPRRYVLAVGSLVAHKNLASLGDLAQALARRGLDLAVVGGVAAAVFGSGNTALPQPAKYLGRVSDGALRALYEAAACLVFPSRYEGFGIPPIEAMACRCPVIAARAGAVMEVCGDAALYCDPDDPAQFTAAVGRVLDEPGLADALRARGAAQVRPLTWDNAAAALIPHIAQLRREH